MALQYKCDECNEIIQNRVFTIVINNNSHTLHFCQKCYEMLCRKYLK